jgi:DNA-binding GntR family transcriptional regulator
LLRGVLIVSAVTFVCYQAQLQDASTALLLLLAVVLQSLDCTFLEAAVISVFATGSLDYFFTDPVFSFAVTGPLERDGMITITPRRGTFIRDISPDEVEVVFSVRGKLEGLCVRYMREDFTAEKKAFLMKALDAMKAAASAKDDERFLQADMRLHRTIWKLSGKQHLYRTLNFVMNPLFFMIARAYSTRLNTIDENYRTHKRYIETILKVPIPRVEREVERYFSSLYKDLNNAVFHRPALALWASGDEDAGHFGFDDELSGSRVER